MFVRPIHFVFLALCLTVPLFAYGAVRPQLRTVSSSAIDAKRVPDARAQSLQILRQARAAARKGVSASAITSNRSARALVIPAAGSVAGANGTYFRSDVTFANWNDFAQIAGIMWVPNGNPNGVELRTIVLDPLSVVTIEDFIDFLDLSGLGSVVILPLDEQNDYDGSAAIDIYSRIWTPQPNASGTVSQPFPAVEPSFLTFAEEGAILGLRQDAQYRTNFGILNLSEEPLTFAVSTLAEGHAPSVQNVVVQSLSMTQQGLAAGDFGPLSIMLDVTSTQTMEFTWVAYGSSTDNLTGDGWVSLVANPWNDADLDRDEGAH